MSRTTFIIALLLAIAMAGFTTGCVSPLDSDTPRVETPLTPAPTVDPISITADFEFSGTDYAFNGDPIIKVDTTVTPMRFWMDFSMYETGTPTTAMIESFDLKLDSAAAHGFQEDLTTGEVVMWADIGAGLEQFFSDTDFNRATILIAEYPREEGQPRRVSITLYLVFNEDQIFQPGYPSQEVFGRIELEI